MNIIIILFTIFKNWLKGIKSKVLTLFLCVIGLLVSFYLYNVYNHIQEQNVQIIGHTIGMSNSINDYTFTYGMPIEDELGHPQGYPELTIEKSINYDDTLLLISKDSLYSLSHNQSIKKRLENIDSLNVNCGMIVNLYWDYYDNMWFLPHNQDDYESLSDNLFESNHPDAPLQVLKDTISNDYIHFESTKIEPYMFHSQRWFGKNYWHGGVQSVELWRKETNFNNSQENNSNSMRMEQIYEAHWYSAYDISKLVLDLYIQIEPKKQGNNFIIEFIDFVNVENVYPIPDKRTANQLVYNKFNDNNLHLKLYLNFPKNASIQQARNYLLSAIITLFFTLITTITYNIIKKKYIERKERIKQIKLLCEKNKYHTANNLFLPFIINDSFLFIVLFLPIAIINPFKWSFWQTIIAITSVLGIIFLLFGTIPLLKNARISPFYIKLYKCRIYIKLFLTIIFSGIFIFKWLPKIHIAYSVLLIIGIICYVCFRIYCLIQLKNQGMNYFYRKPLKNVSKFKKIHRICIIFMAVLLFVEFLKYIVECNMPKSIHINWAMINYFEIVIAIICLSSYLYIKICMYRRKV